MKLVYAEGAGQSANWGPLSLLLSLFYLILSTYDTENLAKVILLCVHKVYLLHTKVKWRFKFIKIWVNVDDVYEVDCGW